MIGSNNLNGFKSLAARPVLLFFKFALLQFKVLDIQNYQMITAIKLRASDVAVSNTEADLNSKLTSTNSNCTPNSNLDSNCYICCCCCCYGPDVAHNDPIPLSQRLNKIAANLRKDIIALSCCSSVCKDDPCYCLNASYDANGADTVVPENSKCCCCCCCCWQCNIDICNCYSNLNLQTNYRKSTLEHILLNKGNDAESDRRQNIITNEKTVSAIESQKLGRSQSAPLQLKMDWTERKSNSTDTGTLSSMTAESTSDSDSDETLTYSNIGQSDETVISMPVLLHDEKPDP